MNGVQYCILRTFYYFFNYSTLREVVYVPVLLYTTTIIIRSYFFGGVQFLEPRSAFMLATLFSVVATAPTLRGPPVSSFEAFADSVRHLQMDMISKAKLADPTAKWTVDEHSRGRAVIIEDGQVWEKGCISVTLIENGELSAIRASTISGRTGTNIEAGAPYSACALSFVLHARSPLVPTLRGDVRVFVVGEDQWFGGGLDLTPSYVEPEDCVHFHSKLASLCNEFGTPSTYAEMKAECDRYFFLPARGEHRGVGGIFYDDLSTAWAPSFSKALISASLDEAGPYMPIVRKRLPIEYTEAQKQWQVCLHRSRRAGACHETHRSLRWQA